MELLKNGIKTFLQPGVEEQRQPELQKTVTLRSVPSGKMAGRKTEKTISAKNVNAGVTIQREAPQPEDPPLTEGCPSRRMADISNAQGISEKLYPNRIHGS